MAIIAGNLVKNFRLNQKLSQSKLAEILGIQQSSLALIEKDVRGLPKHALATIKEKFGYDLEKEYIMSLYENTFLEEYQSNKDNIVAIPFYNLEASAGTGCYLPEYVKEENKIFFDKRYLNNILNSNSEDLVIFKANGNSMDSGLNNSDDIKNGDLLLVNTKRTESLENNKTYIVRLYNSELYVKKVFKDWDGTISLISNNLTYQPIKLNDLSEAKVIGQVIWNGSKTLL